MLSHGFLAGLAAATLSSCCGPAFAGIDRRAAAARGAGDRRPRRDRRHLDHTPGGMARGDDALFLVADVRAGKDEAHGFAEHSFIPYLSISYALTKDGAPTYKQAGLLYPAASKSGPHYAAAAAACRAGHLSPDLHRLSAQHPRHDAPDRQGRRRARLVETHPGKLDLHLSRSGVEMNMKNLSLFAVVAAWSCRHAQRLLPQAPIEVHLKNHQFTPSSDQGEGQPAQHDHAVQRRRHGGRVRFLVAEGRKGGAGP